MLGQTWSLPAEDGYDVVAIACSAGGLRALQAVLGGLPASFPASILIALHRGETSSAVLVTLLQRRTALEVKEAEEGERCRPGTVYIAPGGRHLELTAGGRLSVLRCGRIQFVCPSADVLFGSVAMHCGRRALALVLSGKGSDGAAGLQAMRLAGGFVVAQDPRNCEHSGMPSSAIETRKVDLVLALPEIGFALETLTQRDLAAA